MRRARVGGLVAIALTAAGLVVSQAVQAAVFTGTFGPTIYGGLADVNGSGGVTAADDSNDFFGETDIIDGGLDCDAWNDGVVNDNTNTDGDKTIDGDDDCTLLAFDGTNDGATIEVENGSFASIDGVSPIPSGTPLPHVFPDPTDPDNGDIGDSFFAWSAIDGRVDSNGNEVSDSEDCTNDLVGPANVLSSNQASLASCGFPKPGAPELNGLVDLSDDFTITGEDSCANACFFGHDVANGFVQIESSGVAPTPTPTPTPTPSPSPAPPVPTGPTIVIGDGGTNVTKSQNCNFTVTLSPASPGTASVNFAATASNANQITATSGTLVFTPGQTTKSIVVDVLRRKRKRGIVEVTLSGPVGATLTDGVGRCTIKTRRHR